MKYISCLAVLCFLTSCSPQHDHSKTVKLLLEGRNEYDYQKVESLLSKDYQEKFIDGSVEIENLSELKNHIAWGEVMESKVDLKSINEKDGTVITVESFSNYQDEVLLRYPRSFEVTYQFENGKIKNSTIDTIVGEANIYKSNDPRVQKLFVDYISNEKIEIASEMNLENAKKLKGALDGFVAYAKGEK